MYAEAAMVNSRLCEQGLKTREWSGKKWLVGMYTTHWVSKFSYVNSKPYYVDSKPPYVVSKVVLVVSKPHVFNLTGQLVSTPPVFPTLAATDLPKHLKFWEIPNDLPKLSIQRGLQQYCWVCLIY